MRNNTKGTTPARDVNATQRAMKALELRAKKLSYDEIAKQCGYADRGACHKAVQRELDRRVSSSVDELRREECAMLDQLHAVCWTMAMDASNKGRLFAVDRVLAISERRARLMGLDTPVNTAINPNMIIVREVPQGLLPKPDEEDVSA